MAIAHEIPGEEIIRSVLDVYERGQSVDALRRAETFAPFKDWAGINECILAARIAANTGEHRRTPAGEPVGRPRVADGQKSSGSAASIWF